MPEILEDYIDEKDKITDDVVFNLKQLSFKTIEDEGIINYIHWQCQKTLELAKNKNDSKEVARALNLETFEVLGTVMGRAHSVDIDFLVDQMKDSDYAFLVMHNHPSDSSFSRKDIKTFADSVNMTVLIVLGNKGSIYILEKTKQLVPNELLSIRKTLLDWKNGVIDFSEVIEQIRTFGIVYSVM